MSQLQSTFCPYSSDVDSGVDNWQLVMCDAIFELYQNRGIIVLLAFTPRRIFPLTYSTLHEVDTQSLFRLTQAVFIASLSSYNCFSLGLDLEEEGRDEQADQIYRQ